MLFLTYLKKLYRDDRGQYAVEGMVLLATLVVSIAAALHIILPSLADGYMGMAETIAGPVP